MRKTLFRFLVAFVAAALPALAYAQGEASPSLISVCNTVSGLGCNSDLGALIGKIVTYANNAAFGILGGCIIYYGLHLLIGASADNTATETKQAFEYAIMGAAIILGAQILAVTFVMTGSQPNVGAVAGFLESTIFTFIKALISGVLLLNISIQGFLMIASGDEGGVTSARKRFLHGIIGAAIVVLAGSIITAFTGGSGSILAEEAAGIGNFLIAIFGVLAVVGIVMGGFMLIISIDEGLKEKARKLIIASIVALIVVITSGALISLFIFN